MFTAPENAKPIHTIPTTHDIKSLDIEDLFVKYKVIHNTYFIYYFYES